MFNVILFFWTLKVQVIYTLLLLNCGIMFSQIEKYWSRFIVLHYITVFSTTFVEPIFSPICIFITLLNIRWIYLCRFTSGYSCFHLFTSFYCYFSFMYVCFILDPFLCIIYVLGTKRKHWVPRKWSCYRWLWDAVLVLGIELQTCFSQAARVLNYYAVSQGPHLKFLTFVCLFCGHTTQVRVRGEIFEISLYL